MSSILQRRGKMPARVALGLCSLVLTLGSCRTRASSVPLGGVHVEEAAPAPKSTPRPPGSLPRASADVEAPRPEAIEDAGTVVATAPAAPKASTAQAPTAPGAFEPRPYVVNQAWTRLFDLEFN